MTKQSNCRISHVLYRVPDLHQAVEKLRNSGFIVEYGTTPKKAYNALIWFEQGCFIEIFKSSALPFWVRWTMKALGYQVLWNRMQLWMQAGYGWCEWSLESTTAGIDTQKTLFRQFNRPFKMHKAKRKDVIARTLRWHLLIPHEVYFPFLMSPYMPNPRPSAINHPNGITGIAKLTVGNQNLDTDFLKLLIDHPTDLELVDDKKGLQQVHFKDSVLTIEEILDPRK
ncbi:VOC family protein [Sphingobacterium tabacisoli]|uniref:VOC family protein n=1 Tax=Sphingobacterium tabacisoli TaxID=2044855 RepID=A0ABW5L715_9SPHI|nr:VOC family protein [Sphingobacterium tabacisoli]